MGKKITVYFLSLLSDTPKRGYWDMGLLDDLLKDFPAEEVEALPKTDIAIVVLPARSHAKIADRVNKELNKIDNVLLFLMGDEEADFPIEDIDHKNIKIWVQNPDPTRHDKYRKLGTGYPQDIHKSTIKGFLEKKFDWMFAGQITHRRRQEAAQAMRTMKNGFLLESDGFTKGISHDDYYTVMANAKVIPCPSGPETPDTFRLFEALELGCVPIADSKTPNKDWPHFWEWIFGEPVPFPILSEYEQLSGYVKDSVARYPELNNICQAWWIRYKAKLKQYILDDLKELGAKIKGNQISVVIPVSVIPSHPDIDILDETINSVIHHFPDSGIMLTFDGLRQEQEDRRADYNEHIRRILWKYRDANIIPYIFQEHTHQVGMLRHALKDITTPLIVYMEQDTPLVLDYEIEWDDLGKTILDGESNLIRFHFEAFIPDEHMHMMIGWPIAGLWATAQWSQRPHLASTAFYRRILSEQFSDKANCFIEDLMHGKLHEAYLQDGVQGWFQWRVHIYHPKGNIKRSYHTDGRAGDKKYSEEQVW